MLHLAAFTTLYFFLNSWLITFALALQRNLRPGAIWRRHFVDFLSTTRLWFCCVVGLQHSRGSGGIRLRDCALLLMLYLTYQWSNRRIEAEGEKNAN